MGLLSGIGVFAGLTEDRLARLEAGGKVLEPKDGSALFDQGDPGDSVYAVIGGDGRVRVGVIDRRSKALMAEVFRAGDLFGEIAVIDDGPRTAQAVVQGRVRLYRISAEAFRAVLADSPMLGMNLCRILSARLRRTFEMLQDATFESLEVRLARQVLHLSEIDGRRTDQGVRLAGRFRQADLADLLGATPRSIITILNGWRANGMVAYEADRGKLTICREAEMRALVGHGDHD
jgi:CRP-like cAMP-binding protein